MHKKTAILTLFLVITIVMQSCYKEKVVYETDPNDMLQLPVLLKLDGRECFFDAQFNMLRYAFSKDSSGFSPKVEFANESQVYFEGKRLGNNQINNFGTVEVGTPYQLTIEKNGSKKEFDLIFTNNPIIQVICDSEIYDEPKTLARIKISAPFSPADFSSYCGIEHRGKFTKYEDKRSMGFELRQNMNSTSEYSAGIFNFKPNTDWILTSAVIDPSRIRNAVSFNIWNQLSGWDDGKNAKHIGIDSKLIELFLNTKFHGIYVFSERINRTFLNAGNDAVLYKAEEWA
ncbi:MAG TPA: CotH kinase family protein, partial [Prolixibacteraceae bacterium]|nr:CotH kinase family protein [Prolixibacteraceae bacterium]